MSTRVLCPNCNGGRTQEKSCVVYDQNGIQFYRCFRASCDRPFGRWDGQAIAHSDTRQQRPLPAVMPLPCERKRWLASKFALTDPDLSKLRPLWTGERFWFPVRDWSGNEVGGVARSYWDTPKSLTFTGPGYEWGTGSWYPCYTRKTSELWLVEDQLSAVKMSRHHAAVALLGVGIGSPLFKHLTDTRGSYKIVLALDGDALDKATALANKLVRHGLDVDLVFLSRDIKNLNDRDEVEKVACRTGS